LLVDDKPANLVVFKEILSTLNVICISAKSGEEALLKLTSNNISLVLLDIQMPVMDGFETLRRIKKNGDIVWVDKRIIIIRSSKGYITHFQGIILDISEKKKAEKQCMS